MNTIIEKLGQSEKFNDYIKEMQNKTSPIILSGLPDVGMAQIIVSTKEYTNKPICIITYNEIQARKIYEDIRTFEENVFFFPKKEILTYDYIAESKDLPYERINTLINIRNNPNCIVVTTIEAIMQKMISKDVLFKNIVNIKVGEEYNSENLKEKLVKLGYKRYELIDGKGQFSSRGGIIDISLTEEIGIRIEFWGDTIDSVRYFNINTQRSVEMLEEIEIYPMHEYVLEKDIERVCNNILKKDFTKKQLENVNEDIELIKNGDFVSKIEKYFNDFYTEKSNILEYISE